jgi:hypothetical protein
MESTVVDIKTGNPLISDEYRELNRQLHETNEAYGTSGHKYADMVLQIAMGIQAESILDYGAGKCTLQNALPQLSIVNYDPCIEGLDTPPDKADLVVCSDVLEHIEPDRVENVIDDLKRLTNKVLFIQVATQPAKKTLADGRNAHISLHDPEWWLEHFKDLRMDTFNRMGEAGFVATFTVGEW